MVVAFEQEVRERAYQIWLSAGMEEGSAHRHWLSAEQAVIHEGKKPLAVTSAKSVTAKVVRKAKAPRVKASASKSGRAESSSPSMA